MVYYYRSQGARNKNQGMVDYSVDTRFPKENFSKTFEKPLDKTAKVWYNIYVIKREHPLKIKYERAVKDRKVENYGRNQG